MIRGQAIALVAIFVSLAMTAHGQSENESTYSEVFYTSGNLRIQAYLYKPDGDGPFPVVIYNHGSRAGRERVSVPFQYVGKILTSAGYAVLVPERRGYGKSDGPVWSEEVRNNQSLIVRLQAETDDVLAAIDYLRDIRFIDTTRMGIMGWSFGGIVTMLALSRSTAFLVAIDHGVFSAQGVSVWESDVVQFLGRYLSTSVLDNRNDRSAPRVRQ